MLYHLRIARPVSNLSRTQHLYCKGLDLRILSSFQAHAGFDGIMLGKDGLNYHFEFTYCRTHPIKPRPTAEDLAVFYIPDIATWQNTCANMIAAGFSRTNSFNPYWDVHGQTFEDPDGYRVVLQNAAWGNEKPR